MLLLHSSRPASFLRPQVTTFKISVHMVFGELRLLSELIVLRCGGVLCCRSVVCVCVESVSLSGEKIIILEYSTRTGPAIKEDSTPFRLLNEFVVDACSGPVSLYPDLYSNLEQCKPAFLFERWAREL